MDAVRTEWENMQELDKARRVKGQGCTRFFKLADANAVRRASANEFKRRAGVELR
jgi:hypothetical protein